MEQQMKKYVKEEVEGQVIKHIDNFANSDVAQQLFAVNFYKVFPFNA